MDRLLKTDGIFGPRKSKGKLAKWNKTILFEFFICLFSVVTQVCFNIAAVCDNFDVKTVYDWILNLGWLALVLWLAAVETVFIYMKHGHYSNIFSVFFICNRKIIPAVVCQIRCLYVQWSSWTMSSEECILTLVKLESELAYQSRRKIAFSACAWCHGNVLRSSI